MDDFIPEGGIIELTTDQLLDADLSDIGFDGQMWKPSIKAVVVNGIVIFDRVNPVSNRGRKLFNQWLSARFKYKL